MPLTDLACRKAKPREKLVKFSDMGGLQLWVFPNGSKLWRFAYRHGGKQKLLALGKYPDMGLQNARIEHAKARELLLGKRDPVHARRIARLEEEFADDRFEVVAREYVEKLRREGRSEATLSKVAWLLDFALPLPGPLSVQSIRSLDILSVLRGVEKRGRYETARRLRSTIGAVFRYAIATARAETDPTAPLQDALTTPTVRSRAAVTSASTLGGLLRSIDAFEGLASIRTGLQLMALLFPRPGELRLAHWNEFDVEKAVWTIPASRAKMRRPHRVPLAPQAIATLQNLRSVTRGADLLLPGTPNPRLPLSDNTLNAALRRLGYSQEEMTAHGFRATASTLLNESGLWNPDAIERQLGHIEGNDVRRAYARGEHWDERVRMMTWWANYLDTLRISDNGINGGRVPDRRFLSPQPDATPSVERR